MAIEPFNVGPFSINDFYTALRSGEGNVRIKQGADEVDVRSNPVADLFRRLVKGDARKAENVTAAVEFKKAALQNFGNSQSVRQKLAPLESIIQTGKSLKTRTLAMILTNLEYGVMTDTVNQSNVKPLLTPFLRPARFDSATLFSNLFDNINLRLLAYKDAGKIDRAELVSRFRDDVRQATDGLSDLQLRRIVIQLNRPGMSEAMRTIRDFRDSPLHLDGTIKRQAVSLRLSELGLEFMDIIKEAALAKAVERNIPPERYAPPEGLGPADPELTAKWKTHVVGLAQLVRPNSAVTGNNVGPSDQDALLTIRFGEKTVRPLRIIRSKAAVKERIPDKEVKIGGGKTVNERALKIAGKSEDGKLFAVRAFGKYNDDTDVFEVNEKTLSGPMISSLVNPGKRSSRGFVDGLARLTMQILSFGIDGSIADVNAVTAEAKKTFSREFENLSKNQFIDLLKNLSENEMKSVADKLRARHDVLAEKRNPTPRDLMEKLFLRHMTALIPVFVETAVESGASLWRLPKPGLAPRDRGFSVSDDDFGQMLNSVRERSEPVLQLYLIRRLARFGNQMPVVFDAKDGNKPAIANMAQAKNQLAAMKNFMAELRSLAGIPDGEAGNARFRALFSPIFVAYAEGGNPLRPGSGAIKEPVEKYHAMESYKKTGELPENVKKHLSEDGKFVLIPPARDANRDTTMFRLGGALELLQKEEDVEIPHDLNLLLKAFYLTHNRREKIMDISRQESLERLKTQDDVASRDFIPDFRAKAIEEFGLDAE